MANDKPYRKSDRLSRQESTSKKLITNSSSSSPTCHGHLDGKDSEDIPDMDKPDQSFGILYTADDEPPKTKKSGTGNVKPSKDFDAKRDKRARRQKRTEQSDENRVPPALDITSNEMKGQREVTRQPSNQPSGSVSSADNLNTAVHRKPRDSVTHKSHSSGALPRTLKHSPQVTSQSPKKISFPQAEKKSRSDGHYLTRGNTVTNTDDYTTEKNETLNTNMKYGSFDHNMNDSDVPMHGERIHGERMHAERMHGERIHGERITTVRQCKHENHALPSLHNKNDKKEKESRFWLKSSHKANQSKGSCSGINSKPLARISNSENIREPTTENVEISQKDVLPAVATYSEKNQDKDGGHDYTSRMFPEAKFQDESRLQLNDNQKKKTPMAMSCNWEETKAKLSKYFSDVDLRNDDEDSKKISPKSMSSIQCFNPYIYAKQLKTTGKESHCKDFSLKRKQLATKSLPAEQSAKICNNDSPNTSDEEECPLTAKDYLISSIRTNVITESAQRSAPIAASTEHRRSDEEERPLTAKDYLISSIRTNVITESAQILAPTAVSSEHRRSEENLRLMRTKLAEQSKQPKVKPLTTKPDTIHRKEEKPHVQETKHAPNLADQTQQRRVDSLSSKTDTSHRKQEDTRVRATKHGKESHSRRKEHQSQERASRKDTKPDCKLHPIKGVSKSTIDQLEEMEEGLDFGPSVQSAPEHETTQILRPKCVKKNSSGFLQRLAVINSCVNSWYKEVKKASKIKRKSGPEFVEKWMSVTFKDFPKDNFQNTEQWKKLVLKLEDKK